MVAHGAANVLRNGVEIEDQLQRRLLEQLRVLLDRGVEIVDVSLMMLVMVNRHGVRIDVRLQGVGTVG